MFNLFCPYTLSFSITSSIFMMIVVSLFLSQYLLAALTDIVVGLTLSKAMKVAFPMSGTFSFGMICFCLILAMLNLLSMVVYSFPVTTSLSFNISAALMFWLSSVIIQSTSHFSVSAVLPANSPWYLIPFLSIVELISVMVRPVTLCFRLLANMSAGHILLTLICKIPFSMWFLGTLFGILELMVSMVQSFVFLMLVGVYLEEAMTH